MPLRVATVPVPDDPARPHPWLAATVEVERAHHEQLVGHDDLVDPVESIATSYTWQDTSRRVRLVALAGGSDRGAADPDGEVVGAAHVWMPLRDNRTLGYFFPNHLPGQDESAVYDALWQEAARVFDEQERRVIHCWATHPPQGAGARRLAARSGAGAVEEDERARWLARTGFVLEQVERYSVLSLDAAALAAARRIADEGPGASNPSAEAGPSASPRHRLRSWIGVTPLDLREGMAALRSRMSVDAPGADLDYEEEAWDVDQIVRRDERMDAAGRDVVTTVALHEGRPVAYTEISVPRGRPVAGFQDDTLVHGDHRGHRLGARVKAANLLALHAHQPATQRLHTWNAEENTHMLAINAELGFRTAGVQGGWQLRR